MIPNAPRFRIFERAAEVVKIIALDHETDLGGLRRPVGTIQVAPVSTLNMQETFDRLIVWKRPGKSDDRPADCPAKIAATYLARIGEWHLPILVGIIEAPIMRPDGTILSTPGYDERNRAIFIWEK